MSTGQSTEQSTRLRPGVDVYAVADGHVLRVGGEHHRLHLDADDADALLDALVTGTSPADPRGRAAGALDALADAGLTDLPAARVRVDGDGALADAIHAALLRMGAVDAPDGAHLSVASDPAASDAAGRVCWLDDGVVVLSPPAVPAHDVAARRRAALRHRDTDPRTRPVDGGRRVTAAPSPAGLELAATVVAAELLRPEAPAHEAVLVDLGALTVTRHPVLPVPAAPR